jgi:hypothetical protein
MDTSHHSRALDDLVHAAFQAGRTPTRAELLRQAEEMSAPQALLARLQLLPDRAYDREQLLRALPPEDEDLWRSDIKLPLAELDQALATYSFDGQVDDASGNDSGDEELREKPWPGPAGKDGDPDPESEEGRRLRPSFDGRPGPN